jgi:hypothetical protein
MKVGIFYNSISNPTKFSNKVMLMDNFRDGVLANSDEVIEYKNNHLPDQQLDAGFVLGYTLEDNFRKKIIDQLTARRIPRIFVDSNILHYSRKEHEWHRYSLNSVYPNDGTYFFNNIDNDKWQKYSEWHGVELKPWRTDGDHILILCQRPAGWNMFGNNQERWLKTMITRISTSSHRSITVRMHPGDGTREQQISKLKKHYGNRITISQNQDIRDDLKNCWCVVGYNSTPNVVAAIEGVPVYVGDPIHSWAKDIAFTDISQVENPSMPDRTEWVNKIANIHWSNDEVKTGKLWSAIKNYIASSHSEI